MQFDESTFCAASWFQIRNTNGGSYRVCCQIDPARSEYTGAKEHAWPAHHWQEFSNSEYVQYLRQNLSSGNRLPECHSCWKKESLGQLSQRQIANNSITRNHGNDLKNTWIAPFMKHQQDFTTDLVVSADVKLTNLCNFACVMCNSDDSSQIYTQWSRDSKHEAIGLRLGTDAESQLDRSRRIFVDRNNHGLLTELLTARPKNLKISGGEPLLDTECLDILSAVPDQQKQDTALCFVTNGSQDLSTIYQRLSGYLNVHFVVSVDGLGPVQDYIRRGSDWLAIQDNIDRFIAAFPGHVSIHHTSQALNVHVISSLEDWCQARQIGCDITFLSRPSFMSYSAIPDSLRHHILTELYNHSDSVAISSVIATLQHSHWVPEHTDQLNTYLEWYDPQRNRDRILDHWLPYF